MQSAPDITIQITSTNARSEQRINPAWTITRLKTRLAPITGIPVNAQALTIKTSSDSKTALTALNGQSEDETTLAEYSAQLSQPDAEIVVSDTRPPSQRENYTDVSAVQKYEMSHADYEKLDDSVLAWKRTQKLGRFDPNAPDIAQKRVDAVAEEIGERKIALGARCRLLPADTDARRGQVAFIGEVEEIPGLGGAWVGIVLDEPVGKNDGSLEGKRYFTCGTNCGVFVRPHRVEVGDFRALDELNEDEEF